MANLGQIPKGFVGTNSILGGSKGFWSPYSSDIIPKHNPELWLISGRGVISSDGLLDTWQDQSGNGNHFIQTGTNRPTYHASGFGPNNLPYVDFDGSNDFMDRIIALGSQVTVMMVCKRVVTGSHNMFNVGIDPSSTNRNGYYLNSSGYVAQVTGTASTAVGHRLVTLGDVYLAEWEGGGASLRAWMNGEAQTLSGSGTNNLNPGTTFSIGREGDSTPVYYRTVVAEIVVFDKLLSDSARAECEADILSRYAIKDSFFGHGLDFDGVNDYGEFPEISLSNNESVTVSAWVKLKEDGFTFILSNSGNGYWLGVDEDNVYFNPNTGYIVAPHGGAVNRNQWAHVAITRNGNSVTFYCNGQIIGTGSYSAGGPVSRIAAITQHSLYGAVVLDELAAVRGVTASPGQIAALYNNGAGANFIDVVGSAELYYRMNSTSGTDIINEGSLGSAYNAEFKGATVNPWVNHQQN